MKEDTSLKYTRKYVFQLLQVEEMQLLNKIRYMFDTAGDTSPSGNCLAFLHSEVRGHDELQNSGPGAGSTLALLKST